MNNNWQLRNYFSRKHTFKRDNNNGYKNGDNNFQHNKPNSNFCGSRETLAFVGFWQKIHIFFILHPCTNYKKFLTKSFRECSVFLYIILFVFWTLLQIKPLFCLVNTEVYIVISTSAHLPVRASFIKRYLNISQDNIAYVCKQFN